MNKTQDKKLKKLACEQMYVEYGINIQECAEVIGVCDKTIYRWIRKHKWKELKTENQDLERQIYIIFLRVLKECLKRLDEGPEDHELLDSLYPLIDINERFKQEKVYKDNIIKFIKTTVEYFQEKNMKDIASAIKDNFIELVLYLQPGESI